MKVRCINSDNKKLLTIGKIYDVVSEVEDYYRVYDNTKKLVGMYKSRFEIVEENENMSKEYSFSEMIDEYAKGYEGQFKQLDEEERKIVKHDTSICYEGLYHLALNNYNIKAKYSKIDKEVPVHEAIKALKEGKEIYCISDLGNKSVYESEYTGTIATNKIKNYKWYISE